MTIQPLQFQSIWQNLAKTGGVGQGVSGRGGVGAVSFGEAQDSFLKAPRFAGASVQDISLEPLNQMTHMYPVLIVPVHETKSGVGKELKAFLAETIGNENETSAILDALKEEKFKGQDGKVRSFELLHGASRRKLILVGLGRKSRQTPYGVEQAMKKAYAEVPKKKNELVGVYSPDVSAPGSTLVEGFVGGAYAATYRMADAHKKSFLDLPALSIYQQRGLTVVGQRNSEVQEAQALAEGVSLAKDLGNLPYSKLKVEDFVNYAREVAGRHKDVLSLETFGPEYVKKNMPAFYAVAQGSDKEDPPQFIKLKYTPAGGKATQKVAVVGKTILFDTGGVQDKGEHMPGMHMDMCGGANTLGIMEAIARLKPDVEVTAYMAATPNRDGPRAYVPDDVIDSQVGKKIVINNVDAEGRMTLIDAVHEASKDDPDFIVTLATLTGAANAAVGGSVAAMTNIEADDDELRDKNRELLATTMKIAEEIGEPFDALPVRKVDFEAIASKKDNSDIMNTSSGGKGRGAQGAGAFVMLGVPDKKKIPLLHLDIAGAAGIFTGGATANSVRTVVKLIQQSAQ